jgi:hypothetical protein
MHLYQTKLKDTGNISCERDRKEGYDITYALLHVFAWRCVLYSLARSECISFNVRAYGGETQSFTSYCNWHSNLGTAKYPRRGKMGPFVI